MQGQRPQDKVTAVQGQHPWGGSTRRLDSTHKEGPQGAGTAPMMRVPTAQGQHPHSTVTAVQGQHP